ncbi:acyltransferase family protein [Sodalinema gerasimenkoae]|uniref:acyltransferase family protein n=1 Tax=Sodalinema gerasimenkoae TaxID=2862348 RepID=UPI00135AB756|nr:acyltransferase [Sodalinema gerasimenkoae]
MADPASKPTIFELNLLRVIGIGLILYSHSTPYLGWSPRFDWFIQHPGTVGLGIFFCLSGFLMQRSHVNQGSDFQWFGFIKKRLIRILPLYWLAIIIFVVQFHYFDIFHDLNFKPLLATTLAHLLALQLFFIPKVSEMITLWYIGALIPYYLLFSWTCKFNFRKFIGINGVLWLSAILLKLVIQSSSINLGDVRILLHYPTFLLGVTVATFDPHLVWVKAKSTWLSIFLGLAAIAYIPMVGRENINLGSSVRLSWDSFLHYGYCLVWSLLIIAFVFRITGAFSKTVTGEKPINYLSKISYSVYLFHRPIYGLIYGVVIAFGFDSTPTRTLLFPIATLALLVVSDVLTRLDVNVIKPYATQFLNSN